MEKIFSKCGMRCDLCLIYRPNVSQNDRRREICNVYSKIYPGYKPDPNTIICDGCSTQKENPVLLDPACKTRKCVIDKKLEHCGYCSQYPCSIFPAEPTQEELVQKIDVEKQWTWEDEKLMEAYTCKKNMDEFKKKILEKDYLSEEKIKIHYAEIENDKMPLLLIHGQCMCFRDYESVFGALSEHYHVFAVDCPGHGESVKNAELYTCRKIGDILCEFVQQIIGEACVVSGHSSGGILAAYVAGKLPGKVKGLLLEDPPFFNVEPAEMQNTFVYKDGFQIFHNYLNQTEETDFMLYYLQHSYIIGLFGKWVQNRIVQEAREYMKNHPDETLKIKSLKEDALHGYRYIRSFDFQFAESFYTGSWFEGVKQEEILLEIKCPTVYLKAKTKYGPKKVLWAANTEEASNRMMNLIANAKRIVVKSGHDIHYEKPEEFVKALEQLEERI